MIANPSPGWVFPARYVPLSDTPQLTFYGAARNRLRAGRRSSSSPGLADEMLRELAPLLAEEGIDVDNIDVPDLDTLQQALNRAVERQNMARFAPIGQARELAAVTLQLAIEAIADGNTTLAAAILDQVPAGQPVEAIELVSRSAKTSAGVRVVGC